MVFRLVKEEMLMGKDLRVSAQLLTYDKAKEVGAIEPGVAPVVDTLNKDGVCKTIASCHGHARPASFFRRGFMKQHPFVLFRADIELARSIAKYLDFGHGINNELYYCWRLESYFYPGEWELVWNLKLGDKRVPEEWNRSRIDKDLKTLSEICSKLLINLCEKKKTA
jgi:hypothetical protein